MFALNLKYSAPFGTLRCPENHHIEKFSKLIIPDCPGSNIAEASSKQGHTKSRFLIEILVVGCSVLVVVTSCYDDVGNAGGWTAINHLGKE